MTNVPCALSIMSVISKLVILLLLILGNLGLWRRTTCYAQDTSDHLKPGDQLNHTNPTICSARRSYCLKFMKIDSYSPFYYLTVYSGFLESSVWIANRNDQSLNASSEALILNHSGVLKITHQGQEPTILYSPSAADQPQDLINNTRATLLETGNFVLQYHHPNGSNIVLWQSFDYPTDTLLPGMRLGVNHKTGKKWSLVSYFLRISASPGPFTLEWEARTGQLIILLRGQVYWASGLLRNGKFENLSEEAQSFYSYTIFSNKDEDYFTFSPRIDATKIDKDDARWSIDPVGRLFERSNVIARAGDCYGYASNTGCQLRDQPACRHKGEFFDIMYVTVRDQGITYSEDDNASLTITDCRVICWSNCHCVGFTSYNNDATGCVFYFENSQMNVPQDSILQINFLANRSELIHEGGPAQAPSPGPRDPYQDSNASAKRIILLAAVITTTLLIICAIVWILLRKRKIMLEGKKRMKIQDENGAKETLNEAANLNGLQNYKKDGHALKFFSYASIMEATDSFSSNNKLGQGGFGHVYKGKLHDGKEVAIKKLSRSSRQGVTEFKTELTLISELQHRNLVQLLGYCIQGEERILIYEFMPNKSLDLFLFDTTKSKLLDWKTRFNIIEGIAQGLLYLHKYSRLRVVHRDLKASNILLDENMNPKISDFGLARIITQESEGSTQRIVGTYGYMPPEYAMEGIYSIKSDVYSFGILMLEIVSGRRNNSFYNENSSLNVVGHAWELWKDCAAIELVDQGIKDSLVQEDQVLRCIQVALLCAEERAVDRPTMADILSMLTSQSSKLPSLKRPALCFVNNSSVITDSSYHLTSLIKSMGIQVTEKKRRGCCDTDLPCEGSLREAASCSSEGK